MSRPWFPFYVGDYVRDTARLTTEAHGAYLLLMLDYWARGPLPDNDEVLATISKLPLKTWRNKVRPFLAPFFVIDGVAWRHNRIDRELAIAETVGKSASERASGAAKKRWAKRQASPEQCLGDAPSISQAMLGDAQSQPQSQKEVGVVERAPEPDPLPRPRCPITEEAFVLAAEVVLLTGRHEHDPICVGAPLTIQGWFNAGWNAECIKVGVKRGMASRNGDAPSTLKYFEKAIARAHAELTPSVPIATIVEGEKFNVQNAISRGRESLSDVARRQAAAGITFGPRPTGMPADTGDAEGRPVVRLLSEG